MTSPSVDAERDLLCEALGIPADTAALLSREPLGSGGVTGFVLADDPSRVAYLDTSLLPVRQETGLALPGVARVWLHPSDPHLPALAPAAYGDAVQVLLGRLGIVIDGAPTLVGYRPGRRAVLRVPSPAGDVWVKVVRPRRIARIVDAHTALRGAGLPVPEVRGWSPEGLLVLDGAVGTAATEARWQPEPLLDAVDEVRARLAAAQLPWPARVGLRERLPWYTTRLRDAGRDIGRLEGRIAGLLSDGTGGVSTAAPTTVHGDLHLGQLFLGPGGAVSGLIDVDTAGQGDPADDASAFIGHAVASALLTEPGERGRVWALADAALARWGSAAPTRGLTSVHLLGHALGAVSSGAADRADALLGCAGSVIDGGLPNVREFS